MTMARLGIAVFFALAAGLLCGRAYGDGAYRIRPGDTLRITVLRHPEYSHEAVVRTDGRLSYFLLGDLDVAGATPEEVRETIRRGIRGHLSDADVIVAPVLRANEVYIGGQVTLPNRYTFYGEELDLRRALMLAGGPLPDSADLAKVYLFDGDGPPTVYDLVDPGAGAPSVRSGAAVYVAGKVAVHVAGNVQKPGVFYVDKPVTVAYALALAGGSVDDKGDPSELVILRKGGGIETVSLSERFWADGGAEAVLGDADTLYVPNAYRIEEISVLGYVHRPGVFRVRGPVPVARALALAGGIVLEEASRDRAEVQRKNGGREWVSMETEGTSALVFPGDTLRVPRRFHVNWPMLFSLASTAALVYRLLAP
jgi:polysaccharide export outer membrane protein